MTFDANGNLATVSDQSGNTSLTWDARNRLTALTGPDLTGSFAYDALGRRVQRVFNGQATQVHSDDVDSVSELANGTEVSYLRTLNVDEALGRGAAEFYLTDALRSTVALTDEAGAVLAAYTYEPFGRTVASGVSRLNPFQFTGRENDGGGFYYYRARYYSPTLHRFLSPDPIGFKGGINVYAYVNGNPSTLRDPFGLDTFALGIGGSFGYTAPSGRGISETSSLLVAVDTQGNIGILTVHGPLVTAGTPGPSAHIGIQGQSSNACQIAELAGPFYQAGATVAAPVPVGGVLVPLSVSADVFGGNVPRGGREVRIEGSDVIVGFGTPGVSGSGGETMTEVLYQVNALDLLKRLFNPGGNPSGRGKPPCQ